MEEEQLELPFLDVPKQVSSRPVNQCFICDQWHDSDECDLDAINRALKIVDSFFERI